MAQSLRKSFAQWSRIPPEVWATEIYRLPNGNRFKWEYAPYSRAMFKSIFEPRNIETVFQLYSRGLKSTMVLIAMGYIIDQAPRRILSLWPTNSQCEKFSKDCLCGELLDTTPCLSYLGSNGKQRTGNVTLLHKAFPGGLIDLFGANAPGDMRRAKGSFLYADEIDAIGETQTDEGDQLAIFNKRGDEYPDTIRVFASYPSIRGGSRVFDKMQNTDGKQWFSTCVKCGGEPYVMHRSQIRYEKDKPESAVMECPKCREFLTDGQRYLMAHGQGFDNWRPQREYRGRSGFQANAMLWPHPVDAAKYPGGFLQMVAQSEIDADKADNPNRAKRVIVNTVDAEPFDPVSENEQPPEWMELYKRREKYAAPVPKDALILTAFVDVQINRLECGWWAWGRGAESWAIEQTVIEGNTRSWGPWGQLRKEFARKFKHERGPSISLSMAHIDGGWNADWVYAFLKKLAAEPVEGVTGKVRASKGVGRHGHPIIDSRWNAIAKNLKGHHIGTWAAKDMLYLRLRMKPNEEGELPEGWIHFPDHFDQQWFEQLCSEKVTIEYKGGEEIRKYENPDKRRNEALDIFVGNLAAYHRRTRWNFDMIEAGLKQEADEINQVKKPKPQPEPQRRRSNYLGGFR